MVLMKEQPEGEGYTPSVSQTSYVRFPGAQLVSTMPLWCYNTHTEQGCIVKVKKGNVGHAGLIMPVSRSSLTAAKWKADTMRIIQELGAKARRIVKELISGKELKKLQVLTFKPGAAMALATA